VDSEGVDFLMSVTMESRETAAIHPLEFWTDYQPNASGGVDAHDWAMWVKKGVTNGATTSDKIARIRKSEPIIWAVLERHYKAWKEGQAAPVVGTPLDAMPFMPREAVKVLAGVHVRSVEDFVNAEDAALSRLNVPGIRGLRDKSRAFLDAQANTAGVAAELAALREQVELLTTANAQVTATADAMAELAGKRRGRPPNIAPMEG